MVCIGYRDWALNIYSRIQKNSNHEVIIIKCQKNFDISFLNELNPDLVLFYGWSWKVPEEIFLRFECLMLHPSDLPKFRGGSPIQNQIISNVVKSKVTIFKITSETDAGPILVKKDLDLSGELSAIFDRIEEAGFEATMDVLNENFTYLEQSDELATYSARRMPYQSEITLEDLKTSSGLEIYNKVRCLQEPYPNAFIRMSDGTKLNLISVRISGDELSD
jgi:methionyl-tRNA formyltransferase